MLTTDKINCSLDFERDGKHFGNLELSFSDNQNAFAKIPVAVVSLNNGQGEASRYLNGIDGYLSQARRGSFALGSQLEDKLLPAIENPAPRTQFHDGRGMAFVDLLMTYWRVTSS